MTDMTGTSANDTLTGGNGNDLIAGQGGNDLLNGGGGNDTLDGGAGSDMLFGGAGDDTFRFGPSDVQYTNDVITDFGQADRIDLSALGATFIGEGEFTGTIENPGSAQVRVVYTGHTMLEIDTDGDGYLDRHITVYNEHGLREVAPGVLERVPGQALAGGAGDDTLEGTNSNDTLDGGDGNDLLRGFSGFDRLDGGAGDDTLEGGGTFDTLTGGSGDDVFRFLSDTPYFQSRITDLVEGDRLDLSALGAVFLGEGAFTGSFEAHGPAQMRLERGYGTLMLQIDRNGDGYAVDYLWLEGVSDVHELSGSSGVLVWGSTPAPGGAGLTGVNNSLFS